jgi:hypothetical protein
VSKLVLSKRIQWQAGARAASVQAADERRHQSFGEFLKDKRDFGDHPTMTGYLPLVGVQ